SDLDFQPFVRVRGRDHRGDAMAHEHVILDGHALAHERMAGNLAAAPDFGPLLDLDERADLRVVPDFAPVEVGEGEDLDVFTQLDRIGDEAQRRVRAHTRARLPGLGVLLPSPAPFVSASPLATTARPSLLLPRTCRPTAVPCCLSDSEEASRIRTNSRPC